MFLRDDTLLLLLLMLTFFSLLSATWLIDGSSRPESPPPPPLDLKALVAANKERTDESHLESHLKLLRLLESYGLTRVETERDIADQIAGLERRMVGSKALDPKEMPWDKYVTKERRARAREVERRTRKRCVQYHH